MKKITLLMLSLMPIVLSSQTDYDDYFYPENFQTEFEKVKFDTSYRNYLINNSITNIKVEYYFEGKLYSTKLAKFDTLGRLVREAITNKKRTTNIVYTYDKKFPYEFAQIIEVDGKCRERKNRAYQYNENQNISSYILYLKDKPKFKYITKFNANNRPIERVMYYKNFDAPNSKYEYDYYEDNSPKETRMYVKNKLKYTWNYDCDPKGKLETKHKDTTTICIKQEVNANGEKVVWTQETNEKNEVVTKRSTYKNDSVKFPYETLYTSSSGDTVWYSLTTLDKYIFKNFYKGKPSFYQENNYSSRKLALTITRQYKRGKLKNEHFSRYEYNNKGMVVKKEYKSQKYKEPSFTLYLYEARLE